MNLIFFSSLCMRTAHTTWEGSWAVGENTGFSNTVLENQGTWALVLVALFEVADGKSMDFGVTWNLVGVLPPLIT